jgi:hypothetical protein
MMKWRMAATALVAAACLAGCKEAGPTSSEKTEAAAEAFELTPAVIAMR